MRREFGYVSALCTKDGSCECCRLRFVVGCKHCRMAELGTVKTLIEAMQSHVDSPNLQACSRNVLADS